MTAGNASLGKRKGQSLVDIFKRPFTLSRKSMTPPASRGSQSKQSNETNEESVVVGSKTDENSSTIVEVPLLETVLNSELEEMVNPAAASSTSETNGQRLADIFPLPLPPTTPSVCLLASLFQFPARNVD